MKIELLGLSSVSMEINMKDGSTHSRHTIVIKPERWRFASVLQRGMRGIVIGLVSFVRLTMPICAIEH
ncbi:hypothetical protein AQZ49_07225 [Novosphingobium sp. FSW06-99]|nr:hypothetical protein AQZ49_07225 [Novosphingobium sp. FSW06-99]